MRDKEVVEVNHIMGHVFSILPERNESILQTPYICMTVSGGHNDIYLVNEGDKKIISAGDEQQRHKRNHLALGESIMVWKYSVTKIGQTVDDAGGEAYDKVSRMLGGPNPGGVRVSNLAKQGVADERVNLKVTYMAADEFLFSFSWIKSQVHYMLQKFAEEWIQLDDQLKANIAYKFQEEVCHVLAKKLVQAAEKYNAKTISLVWGVSANVRLRGWISDLLEKKFQTSIPFLTPAQFVYCTDNAAMIWAAGLVMKIG